MIAVGLFLAVAIVVGVMLVTAAGKKDAGEVKATVPVETAPKGKSDPGKQATPPTPPAAAPSRKEPSQDEATADLQKRVTAFQANMRDRPSLSRGTDSYWRRSVSTVYEFKTDVKVGGRPGYAWVAAVSYKEVSKSTPPCETEALAKAAALTEDPKLVWEHWRLFGYKDGRWDRLERRMRSTGVFNSDWAEGVADNPILAVEAEFFSDRPK